MTKSEQFFSMAKDFHNTYSTSLFTTMILESRGANVDYRKEIDIGHLNVVKKLIDLAVFYQEKEEKE